MEKQRISAVEGWFRDGAEPALLGTRCRSCGAYFFPRERFCCRNPACAGRDLEEVPLSRRGRLWSYTSNCYPPPAPYRAPDPFQPYALAAVELEREKMVVLGQVLPGIDPDALEVGMEMELVVDALYEDDARQYLIWKWKPVGAQT